MEKETVEINGFKMDKETLMKERAKKQAELEYAGKMVEEANAYDESKSKASDKKLAIVITFLILLALIMSAIYS